MPKRTIATGARRYVGHCCKWSRVLTRNPVTPPSRVACMSDDAEFEDLLPDDLSRAKKRATPVTRSEKKTQAALKRKEQLEQKLADKANAAQLAQIVNLHIAGYSLAQIAESIGATAEEVDRRLANDVQRYVRSQPALRVYVRNWVSERYSKLLEAVWNEATDRTHVGKLENQDRALRILDRMAKLHGAEAPAQAEVKLESTPEAVDRLVQVLSAAQGVGYDMNIFDVVDAEVVEDVVAEADRQLELSSNAVEEPTDDDDLDMPHQNNPKEDEGDEEE